MKMAKNKPKPRTAIVNIHIQQGDSVEGIFDEKKQIMSFKIKRQDEVVSAKKVVYTSFYKRDSNKPKFLNIIEFQKSSDFTVSHEEALQRFDHIWAIDTNKKEIFGELANVAVITEGDTNGSSEFTSTLAIIFGLTEGNSELFSWRKFISFVMSNLTDSSLKQFGLIVDSDLGKIRQYNSRELPIHGDFFLPENWTLIYATSDSGKESIFNRMLIESDKVSKKVMAWVSNLEKNVKHWRPITDEDNYQPTFLPLLNIEL